MNTRTSFLARLPLPSGFALALALTGMLAAAPCALGAGAATDAPVPANPPAAEARAGSAPLARPTRRRACFRPTARRRFPASGPNRFRAGFVRARRARKGTPIRRPASSRSSSTPGGTSRSSCIRTPRSGWRRRRGTRASPSSGGASSPATTSTPSGWRCISRRAPPRGLRLPGSTSRRARPRRIPTSAGSRSTVSRQWHRCGSPTRALPPRPLPWTWSTRAAPTRGSVTHRSGRRSRCGSTEPPPVRPREGRPPRPPSSCLPRRLARRFPRRISSGRRRALRDRPHRLAARDRWPRRERGRVLRFRGAAQPDSLHLSDDPDPLLHPRRRRGRRGGGAGGTTGTGRARGPEGAPLAAGRGASPSRSPTSRGARSRGR